MAFTDPAKELAETLALIASDPNESVVSRITMRAGVSSWSPEFFRILFEIMNRLELVGRHVRELPLDEDVRWDALESVEAIKKVFSDPHILNQNCANIRPVITGANATVLKMLSAQIRERVSYPLLSEDDREEVLKEITELRGWLAELQSDHQDFIRQALIEGLDGLIFRMERLQWFGHGYALDGLKEVLQAYLSLQGAQLGTQDGDELQRAILAKARGTLIRVLSIFDLAKDHSDRADWALRAYGAVSAIADGSGTIAGLLT